MAIYVNEAIWPCHGLRWCHLLAYDVGELHRFAAARGIKQSSCQGPPHGPPHGPPKTAVSHYDLTAYERQLAIARGAMICDRLDIVGCLAPHSCLAQGSAGSGVTSPQLTE